MSRYELVFIDADDTLFDFRRCEEEAFRGGRNFGIDACWYNPQSIPRDDPGTPVSI